MRECRKCKNIIPNRITVDGKQHSLQNRKFCLACSPFRGHNTSPHDPDRRIARNYKNYSEEQKERVKLCLYYRALERKQRLLTKHRGKCQQCGYNKNNNALTFHHESRDTKQFGLALNNLWAKPWESIDKESDKCILLCMNCHAEIESERNGIRDRVNEKYDISF